MELRLFAHMTKDPGLMRAFAAGEDIHKKTAALVFGVDEDNVTSDQRRHAKTINFAVIYGMGDMRLAAEMGVSRAIASEWKKRYFEGYPRVKEYAESVIEFAEKNGYVKTLLGRRRLIPDINSRVAQFRAAAQREAVNAPVQGSGADIVKMAMIKASELIAADKLDACMILQVHDELLFECAPDCVQKLARLVRDSMETAFLLDDVPLSVDVKVGKNWSEMLSIENSEYRQ
jgi:DNA polymerase-1